MFVDQNSTISSKFYQLSLCKWQKCDRHYITAGTQKEGTGDIVS